MITVQFKELTEMMRYIKHVRPPQMTIVHHTDEFDDGGIYEMNHPLFEGMELGDGGSEE